MTQNYFTAIAVGASNHPNTINNRLGTLDAQITQNTNQLGNLNLSASTLVTRANGGESSGATAIDVDSTGGFQTGDTIGYTTSAGYEERTVTVTSGTIFTVSAIGGNIADNAIIALIPPALVAAAGAGNRSGTYTLDQTVAHALGGVYNIDRYGGLANFENALEAAFNAAHGDGGGMVLVPPGNYSPSVQKTLTGDNITIMFQGTMDDTNFTTETLGILTFDQCTNVSLVGGGGIHYDASGTAAASVQRFGFYFTDCDGVYVSGIRCKGGGHSQIYASNCDNVIITDCVSEDGYYPIYVKNNTADHANVHIHGVSCHNAINGIIVEGRGTPTHYRVTQVRVTNCYVQVTASAFADAHIFGIELDSCDDVVCAGNYVDANNNATMGYSLASSNNVAFYGNTLVNLTKYPNGTITYTGIGVEVDIVTRFRTWGNYFYNCICAYLVGDCDYFECNDIFEAGVSQATGAVVPSYVCIVDEVGQAKISGSVVDSDNTGYTVYVGAVTVNRLLIENLRVVSANTAGTDYSVFYGSGFTINHIGINGLHIELTDSKPIFNIWPAAGGTCMGSNIYAKVTNKATDDTYRFYRCEVATSRNIFQGPIVLDGLDWGFYRNTTNNPVVYLRDVHFYNMTNTKLHNVASMRAADFVAENIYLDDEMEIFSQGAESKLLVRATDPATDQTNAAFLGQMFLDYTANTVYVAIDTGGYALNTYWKLIT